MSDDLLVEKLLSTAVLLLLTVFFCAAPWLVKSGSGKKSKVILHYLNVLAAGVVLGALLMHMIPELFHHSHDHTKPACSHSHHKHKNPAPDHHSHEHTPTVEPLPEKAEHEEPEPGHTPKSHKEHKHHDHDPEDHKHHDHDHDHEDDPSKKSHKHSKPKDKGYEDSHYPWGCLAAGVSFLFLFSIDRIFFAHGSHDGHGHNEKTVPQKQVNGAEHHHEHSHSHDHEHSHHGHCCHGHQGNGHVQSKSHPAPMETIIVKAPSSLQSSQKAPAPASSSSSVAGSVSTAASEHGSCHSHDLVGGCHMDAITAQASQSQTLVFVVALSLHSLLEGLGVGSKKTWDALFSFLISLFGHKFLEAFALGITVMRAGFSRSRTLILLSVYSILTPLGILISIALHRYASKIGLPKGMSVVLDGLAVGSFIFVSMIEMIPPEFHTKDRHTVGKFIVLCVGFLLMAVVASFHSH